jgi:hypothetical protein
MWRWGNFTLGLSPLLAGRGRENLRTDAFAVRHEPQPAVVCDRLEARMLQGYDARRAPFVRDFILKENLDRFVEAIRVNQSLSHQVPCLN